MSAVVGAQRLVAGSAFLLELSTAGWVGHLVIGADNSCLLLCLLFAGALGNCLAAMAGPISRLLSRLHGQKAIHSNDLQ
jgi:hypothetical protein